MIRTKAVAGVVGSAIMLLSLGTSTAQAQREKSTERIGSRSYELFQPSGLADAPLVVVLHGGFGSGRQAQRAYGWDAKARAGGFVVAFPNGVGNSWNAGNCCGRASQQGVDDVAFLRAVVDDATRKAPVDHRRVFVAGMSNGAMMALRMACQTSVFRGAASVAGTLVTSCDQPASVLQIHGTADRNVPYDGGRGSGFARVDGEAIPAIDARFRRLDACPAPAVSRSGKVTTSRADCPSGRKVELITVERMGHQWPSSPINATDAIWRYFSAL
ncbi:MAG TPA: PHB depolymerase family esterase [Gordonia sp. (in: high G+C Gram-positive bacteria)]|uniref:alpha/beta hydrolase family esterase n=1 Tax=unclassified Gordonia (in: high G+C Gram-positive bacteria) TaxID=2657482 RepID=UPI000FA43111|nr:MULTISPECIES: PHB depolymerase family esterase [unclassified Gordonia (in: high G+C Gram-positive bacteria)]RUP39381.1 MAG: polyhydroxybutyrate depolymerase [Gordonia sp. (in: high G+C Gram-positive bacteria)]HNP58395.1 PHB depolymerase family esterase [Gordonia sp. (in: high G+C Gram-positive bacteria)]HRC51997.1 PHB depolymerase family esterase [Gordonia sp. (in: high G+C Gram-positive bacteria)]